MKNLLPCHLLALFMFLMAPWLHGQSNKVYANSQTSKIMGVCLLCSVQTPQNAVGSNENDYSALRIPIGLAANIEQNLSFPVSSRSKVIVGIGTPNSTLSVQLLQGISVETFNGNTSNNDKTALDHNILRLSSDPHRGTLEFSPTKHFNRIKITLDGGLLDLNDEFRIYYAYLPGLLTECNVIPINPLHYYPFNGNTKDVISGLDLVDTVDNNFQENLVCGKALDSHPITGNILETDTIQYSFLRTPKTIAFWGRVEESGRIRIEAPTVAITIKSDTVQAHRFPFYDYPDHGLPIPSHPDPLTDPPARAENNTPGQLNHYVITYDFQDPYNPNSEEGILCIYKNGILSPNDPLEPRYSCVGHVIPIDENGEILFPRIKLYLNRAQIDELLVYNRKLTPEEIRQLACSYEKLASCPSPSSAAPNPDKIYATAETNKAIGICLGCSVQNPQNAVGPDEENYSSLKIPVGVSGKIEQTLIFPAPTTKNFRKIVIGIGTSNLSVQQLKGLTIETFMGNTSNNDQSTIINGMFKTGPHPNRGTIEFVPKKYFDRIKITLNGGEANLKDVIGIYYVYHISSPFTICGNPPLDPLAYYPLDGNINDAISNLNLTHEANSGPIQYSDNMVCGKKIRTENVISELVSPIYPLPSGDYDVTVSFWANIKKDSWTPGMHIDAFGETLTMSSEKIFWGDDYPYPSRHKDTPKGFNHYILRYQFGKACLYINGKLSFNYIVHPPESKPQCVPVSTASLQNKQLKISLQDTEIDELIIYNRGLSSEEIENLASSYGIPFGSSPYSSSIAGTKAVSTEEKIFITPNPTHGSITLRGNIPFEDSEISIINITGTEVYHSKFTSKTFDLPSNLQGGVYILSVETKDKKVYTCRIILTR